MVMVKSIPPGVQAVFPMLVCKNPDSRDEVLRVGVWRD